MRRSSVTFLAAALLALALPAGASAATPGCIDANFALGSKLSLSPTERQALTIKEVCVQGGGLGLHVRITFGGDISSAIGTGHLSRAVVGIAAYGPAPKSKPKRRHKRKPRGKKRGHAARRKKRRKGKAKPPAGPKPLIVLGAAGPSSAPRTIKTKGLGGGALVVRNGTALGFWIADRRVANIKRMVVRLGVLPAAGKKRSARAADATDDAYRQVIEGAKADDFGVPVHYLAGALVPGANRCAVLKALIDFGLSVDSEDSYGPGTMGPWLGAAQDLYRKLCGGGGTFGAGAVMTLGSTLTSPANASVDEAEDTDVWEGIYAYCVNHPLDPICTGKTPPPPGSSPSATRAAPPGSVTMPASGQILAIRLKGMALPSGRSGDPGPLTQIHFSVLRPQADGSVRVITTSQAFYIPSSGDPNQVTSYNPTNLCAQTGDYLALSTEGGFDPTFYPHGVPYQVLGNVPGSQILSYTKHNGVMNGAQFTGAPTGDRELLMQWDLGTGNQGTALCPGGTKGGTGGG